MYLFYRETRFSKLPQGQRSSVNDLRIWGKRIDVVVQSLKNKLVLPVLWLNHYPGPISWPFTLPAKPNNFQASVTEKLGIENLVKLADEEKLEFVWSWVISISAST